MQVTCPYCSTSYELPDHLRGPGGARVRCPNCREQFVVAPGGEPVPLRIREPDDSTVSTAAAMATAGAAPTDEVVEHADEEMLAALRRRFERPDPEEPAEPQAAASPAPEPAAAPPPASAAPPEPAPPPAPAAPTGPTPEMLVHALLDELERGEGEALARSRNAGRVFTDFGPQILSAWDEYRRRAGGAADVQVFRTALRERWGVDLEPPAPGRES